MIVVHHLNNSRSQRVLWLLEELGLPYEIKRYQRDLAAYPNIARFLQTIHARPAWKRALEQGGEYVYA